jgi:hypothetical protein
MGKVIMVVISRRIRWVGHKMTLGEIRSEYIILDGKHEER